MRPDVADPEKVNRVVAEARDMSEEDGAIIFNLDLHKLSDSQKRELIVKLGAEEHSGQWRST